MRRLVAMSMMLIVAACGTSDPSEHGSPSTSPSPPAPSPSPSASATPTTVKPPVRPLGPAEAAVDALMRSLDAGDCRAAKELVVTPSELGCDVVHQSKGSFIAEGIVLDDVVYRVGEVHDASATVRITWGNGYPTESYDVQKTGGRWKVVFDSAA
jgi:hypothetical protein